MTSVSCTQCGRVSPDDARFCANCGAAVTTSGQRAPSMASGAATSPFRLGDAVPPPARDEDTVTEQAMVEALPPGAALLVVKRGPNVGSRFLLDSDLTTAGRHPESDIFLDDVTVSRRHAEFYRSGETFAVRDVGSLNGIYVNREHAEEATLHHGDEVQIGEFGLVFLTNS